MPQPSAKPVDALSDDSSSAKLLYVFDRPLGVERVTWGSEVRSHEPESSSEEREEKDAVAAWGGGKIWSLIVFDKHLGVGMEIRYGARGGRVA